MSEELSAIIRSISHLPEVARVEMLKETLRMARSLQQRIQLDYGR